MELIPILPKRGPFARTPAQLRARLTAEIKDALHVLGDDIKHQLERVVEGWEHRPDFVRRYRVGAGQLEIQVYPTGPNAQVFKYVDRGTAPHPIAARNAPYLKFRTGYVARTSPNVLGSGLGGYATGEWRSAKVVQHPGTEARNFTGILRDQVKQRGWLHDRVAGAIMKALAY